MDSSKKVKSSPITAKQKELLVEYISARREMYSGKLTQSYTREKMEKNWVEVSNLLNSMPDGPAKDWKQWRKTWVDIKKNTKLKHTQQKKYVAGTGGGPPFVQPVEVPAIEEKVLNIITPVAISGNENILESEVLFEFNLPCDPQEYAFDEDRVSICEANPISVTEVQSVHDYSVPTPGLNSTEPTPKKSTSQSGASRVRKRLNKTTRLQESLKSNERFLKISEENATFDKSYKEKKLLLLENNAIEKRKYYERKVVALESIANAFTTMAADITEIKNVMLQHKQSS